VYFRRTIDQTLAEWAESPDRKPLVLRGARQTGKSSSIRELGRGFELFLELNLERFEDLSLVRACRSPQDLLAALSARHNVARFPERTLLFLDEIQESPEAIGWLRFFREDHPGLFVVAAGSLMEVRLEERGFSFPVGRVTFRTLRPLSFLEFLRALGKEVLAQKLNEALGLQAELPPPLHRQALSLLRDYLFVGGMPEAVVRWADSNNPATVRQAHADLLQALAEDIQKYRGSVAVGDLEAAFESLKHHYGLRFRYESFAPGYKSQRMKDALGKLEAALLIARVLPTSSLALPLAARPRSAPKLLPLDVGLAVAAMGTGFVALHSEPLERLLSGRLAEMFVGQQLLAGVAGVAGVAGDEAAGEPLYFWVSESATGNAETDYLVAGPGFPVPVEVKSGASGALKSLHQFLWRADLELGLRLHTGGLADERHTVQMPDGALDYRLLSLPLYLAEEARRLIAGGAGAAPTRPSSFRRRP
jgi:predicted AAA+ superfamily ATPase